jgi:hypothetical protein
MGVLGCCVMYFKSFLTKSTRWLLAIASLLLAALVYATIDRTAYTTQQLVVIPDKVESDVWSGVENILSSDLGDDSLYQEFSAGNSAMLEEQLFLIPSIEADSSNGDTGTTTTNNNSSDAGEGGAGGSVVDDEDGATELEVGVTETGDETAQDTDITIEEAQEQGTTEEEPVSVPGETVPDTPVSFSIPKYLLAEEVIVESVETESEGVSEPPVVEIETVTEESVSEETEVDDIATEVELVDEITDDGEDVLEVEGDSSSSQLDTSTDEDVLENTDTEAEAAEEEIIEVVPDIMDDCAGNPACQLYSTTFTGFLMPEFEEGHFLTAAQLRLSLAARTKFNARGELQRFVVQYTYDENEPWRTATVIDIEDEISNAINGGNFLVTLDKPSHQSQLAKLKVRVSYQGDIAGLERAYIEGIWLEVTSAEFYEETDPDFYSKALDYERALLVPKFHEIYGDDFDPALTDLPEFTLSYSPQQNILRRAFTAVFSENEYAVDTVRVTDSLGNVILVPVDVIYHDDTTWTVKFLEQPQKLVPGKYSIELVVNENDSLFVDTFEFYWGVLAVNTTKSMYFPGEDVVLNLAALTEKGDTICDASLALRVIDPEGLIVDVPVEQSGSCGKNNVTDVPDYLAQFIDTDLVGEYVIQLDHLNQNGEVVHKIQDSFEVREYIPYDIERTAPTRIYPPAPYTVSLKVKANRVFTGDITERVPRGFVITDAGDAEILTMPTHTEIVWRNISLEEGGDISLSYAFDAPDISPYMYLLGPLGMDGFYELRQWQIASDALTAIASFSGTRTIAGTNLNQTASPFQWSTSSLDNFYFDHSTSTNSHEIIVRQAGDYYVSVNLPQQRTDANNSRTRVGFGLQVNGTVVPESLGRSGYIRNQNGHAESSSQAHFLLKDVDVNDVVTVVVEGLTTIDAGDVVNITGQAQLFMEYIGTGENVFSATTTQTTNSANLNQTTEYPFSWVETRQDAGFVHSDALNPEQIIISNPGTYYVSVNIPMTTNAAQTNVRGRVLLDGVLVPGGHFKQGYSQSAANESDGDSSMHWSGVVVATTTNQVLTLVAQREANVGTVNVTSGFAGSVFIRELPSTEIIAVRGTAVVGGTNWNPAAAAAIQWSTNIIKDATVFTHSTSSNTHQITIAADGDYYLSYNDALSGAVARANSRVAVLKNGTAISGAQTKSHYIRNQSAHIESSASMAILVEDLLIGDVITLTTVAEASAGTLDDSTDGLLLMWKKAEIDYRPDAPSMYNAPFDNIRFASTTPYFDFSATDPDGTSNIEYEFSISTSTGFAASTTFNSAVDSEFFNTASSSDTSPFVEGNKIRLQLTSGDALTDLTTYYWRVRAKDVTGSGEFGDWSTTQSLTVDLAALAPSWYQSYSGQFEGDSLVGTVSSGGDRVIVDASVSPEVLIAYGEGSVTTPRYRFWDGSAWGIEGSAQAVSGSINWVRTAAAVNRDEYAMITLDSANDAYVQIYSASTTSWGNLALMSPVVASVAYRGVAVAYENTSGDVMAVSCTNSPNPVYRTWNGSSWSATSSIPVTSINNCNFVELAADPASDEMILVVRDTGTQYEAFVWDGSAWTDSRVIGSSAKVAREGMTVAYEASGDQAIIAVSNNANNNVVYTTWNGTEFSTNATQAIGNDFEFGRLSADTDTDNMALCYIDEDNDIGVLRWDGGVWQTFTELDTGGNIDTGRPIECVFETVAGRGDYLMAPYSDTTNVRYRAATSSAYNTEVSIGTVEDSFWVQSERAGDGTVLMVALDDTADNLDSSFWNGTSWSAEQTLETSPSSVLAAPYEMYDLSAKRFQFSEGVVLTPPIDFTAVPNQPTWGDISFSSTEPFGTDVKVSVRYTSTTTCDLLVPDAVLPGNAAGFDVLDIPIDLTALSTSTYDQICLEATLTTVGSESAALDEWTLAWVRQPKLIQNSYRWYANGSFLTPTDAWPLGAIDVAENAPITSDMAVSVNEEVRLRLALEGANVELPAFSEAFKLQYAEGSTCGLGLSWRDVGAPASTTALWRGYANSIVGDDWYSGSWSRRVKLTVDEAVVEGGLTDFPVYVNLADLPAEFFDNIQADGDDIRVTEADGVTEVPYELVSINTSLDTGELHFKADLASTTDTEFFIYYGNSGASGYSVSATYGRNNVWSNGYRAVYHFNENPAGAAPQFIDSTGNSNGSAFNLESGDLQAGRVGNAINFDGVNEYITTTINTSLATSTWSIWMYPNAMPQGAYDGVMFSRGAQTSGINFNSGGNRLGYHWNDAANTYSWNGGPLIPGSQWSMSSLLIGQSSSVGYLFAATGTASGTNAVTHASSNITSLFFGGDTCCGGRYYNGLLDEAYLANVQRTASWMQTEFNNKSNPTGFYVVSSEEKVSDGRLLPSTLLTGSDHPETYEEENPTRDNQNALPVGDISEWDFVLQNNGADAATSYCFRMVYEDGSLFSQYSAYPRLITNSPPLAPELYAPFDNERMASTTPWFEFAATDELGDLVAYQIQVDADAAFLSPDINTDSIAQFALFTNLLQPSQKSEFTSGQRIRFESGTPLSNNTTYWWRVRGTDASGSGEYGPWSAPQSVTITAGTSITTWYQTTGDQFSTNNLLDAISSTSTNDIGIDTSFTVATVTSSAIDYDDRTTGNAWGDLSFTHVVTSGSIDYYVEYLVTGENYALIPDIDLPGNSSGFNTSPINLTALDTDTYNQIRLVAVLSGNTTFPRLLDWTVTWAETIEVPTLIQPFDNAKVSTTTPAFTFVSTDPETDDIEYELQISSTYDFAASSTFNSGVNAGFENTNNVGDTSPFLSGEIIRYTAQSALTNGSTYWWRTRAKDPTGTNAWSDYSEPQSFTVDTAVTVSAWHQTTGEQFNTDTLDDVVTTAGAAEITTTVNQVMMAYGEGTGQAPRYRLWDGSAWGVADTAASVGAQIQWVDLEAASTRPEYALATIGTDADVNVQIYDADADSWGHVNELNTNLTDTVRKGVGIAYETSSGDLLAVSCNGQDAVYSVWNGTSWTATTSIALGTAATCLNVELASDPVSDEIIGVFRHTNTGTPDYEVLVWNGSSWGSSLRLGEMAENANTGAAVVYEESGNQAIVALTNNAATTLLYGLWNGTAWSTSTHALGDHIEWASLKRDVGTDNVALCYVDNDNNAGFLTWTGSAWGTFTEIEATANGKAGQPIDCEYEVTSGRDGYLMMPYSDGTNGRYQFFNGTAPSGEASVNAIQDSWRVLAIRGGDGIIHTAFFDDTNDRYDVVNWNGTTWSTTLSITNPSITGTPFDGSMDFAARTYPNFTAGAVRSTSIDFNDGSGPRWERVTFTDTTPGSSYIEYRLYYLASTSAYILVPDSALSGNAAGFTTSPIDISALDRTVYEELMLDAQFVCVSGDCPTLNDWTVEWSEGITVSGVAYDYNASTTLNSGTVGVAVNGVVQVGKTGTVAGDGSWSINNVTVFPDDVLSVFMDGAVDSDEAVTVTKYDGVGDITGLSLARRNLTLGSSDNPTINNADVGLFINSIDEDAFFTVGGGSALTLCVETSCGDAKLRILTGTTYQPGGNSTVGTFENYGIFVPATSTLRVSGNWVQNGTFTVGDSTVIFTATSTNPLLSTASTSFEFNNVTFGETSGSANFSIDKSLSALANLTVNFGTLARGTSTLNIGRNLQIGSLGYMSGLATTTFNGSGSYTWGDSKSTASSTNVGYVVIDGTSKTITLAGNVGAESITIGLDDTLNASVSGYNINVYRTWVNNNSFIPQTGTVTFVGTTTGSISRGSSNFNNLSFSGVGGNWSFTTPTLSLTGNLSIATGTVTMPTGTTTISGSFTNTGTFLHNNGEVRMTSTTGGRTITQSGTTFLNSFYDLVFAGSGSWSFAESRATTSRHFRIQSGSVTLPNTTLTVGGDFNVTGSGSFAHNNGEVILLVEDNYQIRTNGSSFNNLRTTAAGSSWFNDSWLYRVRLTVDEDMVAADVADFPVYVNLANLPSEFFTGVKADGSDIRVINSSGAEVPFELVSINTSLETGELYAKLTLTNVGDTNFYLYYGNAAASAYAVTDTYGRNNVWTNGYTAVYHLEESPTASAPQYVSSVGTTNGTSNNMEAGDRQASQLGQGQVIDGANEFIQTTYNSSLSTSTWSLWMRANGAQGAYDGIVFSRGGVTTGLNINGAGTNLGYHWNDAANTYSWNSGPTYPQNEWFMAALVVQPTTASLYRFASSGHASGTNAVTHASSLINDLKFGQDDAGGRFFNGSLDEVRIASIARTQGWLTTEYNNQASSTLFYAVGGQETPYKRTFTDTNATILGNFVLVNGGDALLPSGTLSIGGSLDNDAEFFSNNGTVRFNSTGGNENIAAGASSFATLEINSVTGDFTVIENATATTAFNLTSLQQFTLSSGRVLALGGSFNLTAPTADTTWTGSTLRFYSATTTSINLKGHMGDQFGTVEAINGTLVKMWNSQASTYVTSGSGSAIYSQDHAAVDGDLNIYGNYIRTTGTEYWSYATDFDGVALGGSARQVDVKVASSSVINISSSTLAIFGAGGASTTVSAISNAFDMTLANSTLNGQFISFSGLASNGLNLTSSTTLTSFSDANFTVVPGRTGISIDASTINQNPSTQLFRINFATTTAGTASNVTLSSGTPASFLWFRDGVGNLYGEAFDVNDGNPGALRFDDSSYLITVSGNVYADDGVTSLGGPTCDGVTPNVRIVVDGGTYTDTTSCNATTGAYSFSNVAYVGDPKIVVYLNTNGGVKATAVTKTPTTNISNMHLYANRVIVRHEDVLPLTIADMTLYDGSDDSDISFLAVDTATDTLMTTEQTELFVFASSTFRPNGEITLGGNGNANSYEGTLALGTGATFTATGTETHRLAGRLSLAAGATFTPASSTVIFTATTTGKSIASASIISLHNVEFAGVGGGWNIGANLNISGDMSVDAGTVTGTGNITLTNGGVSGNGVLSLGGGTVNINRTNTLGGTSAWTFNNLVLGNGTVVGTTTPASSATTTILGNLTISNAHFLDAGSSLFDLAGTGSVFSEIGTFLEDTSTIRFSGTSATVPATNFYNLELNAGAGTGTYTAAPIGILVLNNLVVGGTANTVFTQNANDPVLEVRGSVTINNNGTFEGSNSSTITVLGNYDNNGTYNANGGTMRFTGTGSSAIAAGASSFATLEINGTGSFTVTENATATAAFSLINHSNFTLASGQTMAVGGALLNNIAGGSTTWTGSTLYLFGAGTFELNDSATNESYETLSIASGTHVRVWNTSASSYVVANNGSLYSQDHAGVNGDLYIYGQLSRSSGDDYWSYATDFDGTDLTGGSERAARVYLASGASVSYGGTATIQVVGAAAATTTIANQGSGIYGITIGGSAETDWRYASVRNINSSGVVLTGTPTVVDFSYTDHLVEINNGSAITVAGTVINTNEAKNFTTNIFEDDLGVTGAKNVTATGTSVSSWRFTNHLGGIAGEGFDDDPAGDPGYLVWDDSAALITVSGNVYSDEGSTVSSVCDGTTSNIRLVVAGLTTYDTTCNASTGVFSISNVAFGPLDTLTLYINGETVQAANVSVAPISSISNMHLYENRVIVRHENTDPLTIANMAVWDSSDDSDIPFTAIDAGTDTLSLPANYKLLVWTGKTFEPNGNVTVSGGGAGAAYDGTLEAQANARFRAKGTETHSVGGSLSFGAGAEFVSGSSTIILTTTGASRTIDVNSAYFHNLTVSGSGSLSVSDSTLSLYGTYAQSAGSFTFPTGTTTIGAAFNATGGSFANNGSNFVFAAPSGSQTVRFNGSSVSSLLFSGAGSFSMTDANATSTGSVVITAGTLILPSGSIAVGGSFEKRAGTLTHNTSDLIMTATTSALLTASSSDLYSVRFAGGATYSITDTNITFADSFTVSSGTVLMASGTTAVGGSFVATGASFTHATGTILLNGAGAGKVVNPGANTIYNLQLGAPSGSYTLHSATTTNNFVIASVSALTVNSGAEVTVGGVFLNSVGGAATTWTNTTLNLNNPASYSINTRSNSGDVYGTLSIGANADVRMWYSSAATTTVNSLSSLYSQDHGNSNGALNIYGDLVIASSTEYWSYATDFDGTSLTGSERVVTVSLAPNATTTITTGALNIVGAATNETIVQNQSASGFHTLVVNGGSFNAQYYEMYDLSATGLVLSGTPTISNMANGYFELSVDTGSLVSLSSTTLNANPSKIFDSVGFTATSGVSGYNINLTGETANAWRFTNSYGNISGEGFDIDGLDACGSVRFDNSSCLLTEQTHFRWRADDGGEGAPNSEWFNLDWDYRTRVRVENNDNQTYASTAVKMIVPYDSAMKSDFTDLRFTDDDGLTPIPFWIEKYTASTDAVVWVRIPDLPASDIATTFMYYGNSSASASSSGLTTFDSIDDYEDNSISEYSGDTSLFNPVTSPVYGGTYALAPSNTSGKTTDGIFRFDDTVSQGQIIRYMQYVNTTAGSGDEPCTLFGVQSPGTTNQNYGVCLEQFGTDRISLARDVDNNDTSGVVLATSTVTYATGWYEVEIDWRTTNSITVRLYNSSGTQVASTTATDSTYTSGGYGYAFWFQNGAWDSFTARARVSTKPTVYFGAKQTNGGASWMSSSDSTGNAIPNETVRLRVSVENSGLDVTAQQYRLEYAPKDIAPTCESVDGGDFAVVPNQASCGSSAICMITSTLVVDGDSTTDLLSGTNGTFSSGKVIESPSNETTPLDVDQNYYTELEYVITPTSNATDSYCFRVTNAGTELDFYAEVAELGLQFDPTLGALDLNAGLPISLTPGTTTAVSVSTSVTDFNGVGDLAHATATVYRSGAGASCAPDNNNCYVATTENGQCQFTSCSGNTCTLSCVVDVFFHADPTDDGTYVGQEWLAYGEVEDLSNGYDFASAPAVELITLRAMQVDSVINYGALSADSDTGSYNPTTTVTNLGNAPINVDIVGTSLTDGLSSAIPADLQKVATSTFTYSACVSCLQLSTSTAVTLGINLNKPTTIAPPIETEVYWGIEVPFTASNAAHTGTNIFTAIGVD